MLTDALGAARPHSGQWVRRLKPFLPSGFRRLALCRAVSHVMSRGSDDISIGWPRVIWFSWTRRSVPDPLFIVCETRTGSTLLCDYLNCHAAVDCRFEILNQGIIPLLRYIHSTRDVEFYLDTLFKSIDTTIRCGKIHFSHCEHFGVTIDALQGWFPQARFIVLYRSSLLDQFVSLKRAEATDRWIATRPGEETDDEISVDPHELLSFAQNSKRRYAELVQALGLDGRHLRLSYEELTRAPQETFHVKIWPFLGIPSCPVFTTLRKQNRRPIRECVGNFHEIEPLIDSGDLDLVLEDDDSDS